MTSLYLTTVLLQCLSVDVVEKSVLPILLTLADDPVPNVRCVIVCYSVLLCGIVWYVLPIILTLADDPVPFVN